MAGDFGGVWYWNRFPGIQCDNDAYCYIPLLEELDFMPSKKFADGAEIFQHCRNIGKHFGLYDGALFSTQVRDLRWDDAIAALADQHRPRRRHPGPVRRHGAGLLQPPEAARHPRHQGLRRGTSSTPRAGITTTPAVTPTAAWTSWPTSASRSSAPVRPASSWYRTSAAMPSSSSCSSGRRRRSTSAPTRPPIRTGPTSLQPGWQEERKRNFHNWSPFVGVVFGEPDLVCDFWTELGRNLTARIAGSDDPASVTIEQIMAFREEEDYKIMERLRRRVAEIVEDPDTAEALKPYYRFMCKRPSSSEQYLASFNRPNVTLVDVSASKGVERLTEKGIVADGVEYEVDCVIFASGFEISTEISRRYAIDAIEGRDGLSLFDYWQDDYKTLHGMTSRGFPNQFFMGFIQGGVSANTTAMFEQQAKHIAYIIAEAQSRGATTVEPSQEGQDAWVTTVRELAIDNSAFELSCTPGYYNNEGRGGAEGNGSFLGDFYSPGLLRLRRAARRRGATRATSTDWSSST